MPGQSSAENKMARKRPAPQVVRLDALDWSHYFESNKQRMDTFDDLAQSLQQDIRDLRNEQATESRHLNTRIDTVQKDITDRLEHQTKTLTEHFDKSMETVAATLAASNTRISALEKWRWLVVGGVGAVLFLIELGSKLFSGAVGNWISHALGWK